MSADTAPAAMPGEEDVARALAEALRQRPIPDDIWSGMVESFRRLESKYPDYATGHSIATDAFRLARAAQALFVPILAEKEREIVASIEEINRLRSDLDEGYAALEPFDDALGEDDDGYPDDTKLTLSWRAHTDYSLTLGDLRRARAAAIRAQGE